MNIVIRPAKIIDLEFCEYLLQLPELRTACGEYWPKEWLAEYIDNDCLLLAEVDNRIVGIIVGEKIKNGGSVIWLLSVDNEIRGRGIGSQLIEEFENKAKASGVKWIILYSALKNEKTLDFYKKHDYSIGDNLTECMKYL